MSALYFYTLGNNKNIVRAVKKKRVTCSSQTEILRSQSFSGRGRRGGGGGGEKGGGRGGERERKFCLKQIYLISVSVLNFRRHTVLHVPACLNQEHSTYLSHHLSHMHGYFIMSPLTNCFCSNIHYFTKHWTRFLCTSGIRRSRRVTRD